MACRLGSFLRQSQCLKRSLGKAPFSLFEEIIFRWISRSLVKKYWHGPLILGLVGFLVWMEEDAEGFELLDYARDVARWALQPFSEGYLVDFAHQGRLVSIAQDCDGYECLEGFKVCIDDVVIGEFIIYFQTHLPHEFAASD